MQQRIEFNLDRDLEGVKGRVTVTEAATGYGRYTCHTRCPGDYGKVTLRIEPYTGPTEFVLDWQVTEEQIPQEYMAGVLEGIRQAARRERGEYGALTKLRVVVVDGAFHPVDSRRLSYTRATVLAIEDALNKTELQSCVP